ncbi:MAG: NAD(P)-binding domain-containing protein, partial [Chloroflexi bacterium]|nr:NAD(P)-binding domain-containing protein [Chloroflexota bacterium]
MKIGVLGTGTVGQAISAKLSEMNHDVMIGTRDVTKTLKRTGPDGMGNPPFSMWYEQHPHVKLGTFAQAAAYGEILVNATNGSASVEVLKQVGETHLNGKILIDIANPLDFSKGMPPSLFVCNTDSLGEQIQRAFPQLKVVKTLNTMTAGLMVNPRQLAEGDHDVFVSGDDAGAKTKVSALLKTDFGWKQVIDLGDISSARGTEMILPIWLRLWGA